MDTPQTLPSSLDPATLALAFPQYEIEAALGRGGMGAVYRARHKKLGRMVAIKVLLPEHDDPEFVERFEREARALAQLEHPNIVGVHDIGETDGFCYLIMEFVDGSDLRHLMNSGQLTVQDALNWVPQVCDALQYAHDAGVVHRDFKPENVLIDQDGKVRIADFGLAKVLTKGEDELTLTRSQHGLGTPHYMAPEQMAAAGTVDHRADIYSLGVMLYELLTGELPIGRFAPPSQKKRVDSRLDRVTMKTLESEPGRRYQNVSDLKADLVGTQRRSPSALARYRRERAERESRASEPDRKPLPRLDWISIVIVAIVVAASFMNWVTLRTSNMGTIMADAWSTKQLGVVNGLLVFVAAGIATIRTLRMRGFDVRPMAATAAAIYGTVQSGIFVLTAMLGSNATAGVGGFLTLGAMTWWLTQGLREHFALRRPPQPPRRRRKRSRRS